MNLKEKEHPTLHPDGESSLADDHHGGESGVDGDGVHVQAGGHDKDGDGVSEVSRQYS